MDWNDVYYTYVVGYENPNQLINNNLNFYFSMKYTKQLEPDAISKQSRA